jgi:membrane protease YdiL (CAAX protease family)
MATEVNNLLLQLFPQSASEIEQDMQLFSGGVISVITLCLVAPFIEEMVFRGVFLRGFLHLYSPRRAIVLSALLFGLAHLNIYQFVVASTLGLLSGWLYYATGSLWPAILEHAVYNGGVYSYAQMTSVDEFVPAETMPMHSTSVLIFALATFVVGLWWLFKAVKPIANAKAGNA